MTSDKYDYDRYIDAMRTVAEWRRDVERIKRRIAVLLWLLIVVIVAYVVVRSVPAQAATSGEATYEKWTYPVPVDPDTQSGQPLLDAQGRVFSVVRDNARLQVFRGTERVVDDADGYGAPESYISPSDGCLYVSALQGKTPPRTEWVFIRVPGFACHSFISRAASVPMVNR